MDSAIVEVTDSLKAYFWKVADSDNWATLAIDGNPELGYHLSCDSPTVIYPLPSRIEVENACAHIHRTKFASTIHNIDIDYHVLISRTLACLDISGELLTAIPFQPFCGHLVWIRDESGLMCLFIRVASDLVSTLFPEGKFPYVQFITSEHETSFQTAQKATGAMAQFAMHHETLHLDPSLAPAIMCNVHLCSDSSQINSVCRSCMDAILMLYSRMTHRAVNVDDPGSLQNIYVHAQLNNESERVGCNHIFLSMYEPEEPEDDSEYEPVYDSDEEEPREKEIADVDSWSETESDQGSDSDYELIFDP